MKTPLLPTLLLILTAAACTPTPHDVTTDESYPDIFPDYIGVTVPADIAPLNFEMASDSIEAIDVTVKGARKGQIHVCGEYADFDIDQWHGLLKANRGDSLAVSVIAKCGERWIQYRDFGIYVSDTPLDEWGITYRRIAPTYEHFGPMGIYQRCLSDFEESTLIDNHHNEGMCINCHTANRTTPDTYVFHVRGKNGATVVHRMGQDELLVARNDSLGGSMVYPYWHPGGRFCAFSTNKTSQMFHTAGNKRTEVYDSQSDIFVYDTERHELLTDTLVMQTYWAENTPVFSPDGKWLYFTTARRQVYPTDYDKERYSLCRISFDALTGHLGDQVDTLVSAYATGKSVTWPRPSYDGRYVMYTQADYGYFSIWHQESDLWLLDLETGDTRPINEVNSDKAESLHNWTTNGRWFLFTSRRGDGVYTRIYLASIDTQGRATKPFLLPQRHPKSYDRTSLFSFNTPDFSSTRIETDMKAMLKRITSDERTPTHTIVKR